MVSEHIKAVGLFHQKMDVCPPVEFPTEMDAELYEAAEEVKDIADSAQDRIKDTRWLRFHLCCEELAETFMALAAGNEVEVLDGLADRLYVLLGFAYTYDLPLEPAFWEVHNSNMSKEKQPDDPHKERVRDKGPNFRPPDIEGLLKNRDRIRSPRLACQPLLDKVQLLTDEQREAVDEFIDNL